MAVRAGGEGARGVARQRAAALLRQRLTATSLASGFSGLRDRYGTTLWVLLALMGILLAVACRA